MGTISVLRRLDDAGVPFLAVVGNHESTRGGQWLDLFERLGLATRLGDEPVVVGDTAFYGLDHVPVSRRDDLDYAFADHDAEYAALVAHGPFEPFGARRDYRVARRPKTNTRSASRKTPESVSKVTTARPHGPLGWNVSIPGILTSTGSVHSPEDASLPRALDPVVAS
jgi:DNA repair exonuclease SbcCD nuclease subunit